MYVQGSKMKIIRGDGGGGMSRIFGEKFFLGVRTVPPPPPPRELRNILHTKSS